MKVDLSRLETMGRTAVRCTSLEQAQMFMDAMWEQYPNLVNRAWDKGETNWYIRGYDKIGEICYKPRIVVGGDYPNFCQSGKVSNARAEGYLIVEFEELLVIDDFGEFVPTSLDIKSLFGMG